MLTPDAGSTDPAPDQPHRSLMLFLKLPGAGTPYLLCKLGVGLLGHEVGLIDREPAAYLRGYGSAANDFDVRELEYDLPSETSLYWRLDASDAPIFHAHFTLETRRLTVELQRTPPKAGVQVFAQGQLLLTKTTTPATSTSGNPSPARPPSAFDDLSKAISSTVASRLGSPTAKG